MKARELNYAIAVDHGLFHNVSTYLHLVTKPFNIQLKCGRPTSITLSAPILFVKMANIDVHNTRQNAINAINCMNAVFWEPQYIFSVY